MNEIQEFVPNFSGDKKLRSPLNLAGRCEWATRLNFAVTLWDDLLYTPRAHASGSIVNAFAALSLQRKENFPKNCFPVSQTHCFFTGSRAMSFRLDQFRTFDDECVKSPMMRAIIVLAMTQLRLGMRRGSLLNRKREFYAAV